MSQSSSLGSALFPPSDGSAFCGWRRPANKPLDAQMIRRVPRPGTLTCRPARRIAALCRSGGAFYRKSCVGWSSWRRNRKKEISGQTASTLCTRESAEASPMANTATVA